MAADSLHHLGRSLGELQQSSSGPRINPSVLVIVIILSVVFFCSGVLHLLARCLGRRRARVPLDGLSSPGNSVRGQLQQLFSLHNAGVEQVFIDTFPVFLYGAVRGLKDSADCAVCLTEFVNEDKLRLLPKCKHAFHMECIDTWLLSHSTCPLCRRSLLPEAEPVVPPLNPISCTGVVPNGDEAPLTQPSHGSFRGSFRASLRGSFRGSFRFLADVVAPPPPFPPPSSESETAPVVQNPNPPPHTEIPTPPLTPGPTVCVTKADGSEKTLRVELGKVNSFNSRGAPPCDVGTSRMARSYSMGSYQYVVGVATLGVPTPDEKSPSKPTHRSALSDSLPELASASHSPGKEDVFWASRGLETPHNLSRVREIMTPSPGWLSPPSQQTVHIDDHSEIGIANASPAEHVVEIFVENRALEGAVEAPSLSLRLLNPVENRVEPRSLQQTS